MSEWDSSKLELLLDFGIRYPRAVDRVNVNSRLNGYYDSPTICVQLADNLRLEFETRI